MITITSAYGRKYNNSDAVINDWRNNRDFRITNPAGGQYINRADWINYNKRMDSVTFISGTQVVYLETGIMP